MFSLGNTWQLDSILLLGTSPSESAGHYSWSNWYAQRSGPTSFQSESAFNGGEGEAFGTKRQKTKINIETVWPNIKITKCRGDNFILLCSAIRIRWNLKSCCVICTVSFTQSGANCSCTSLNPYAFIQNCSWFEGGAIPKLSRSFVNCLKRAVFLNWESKWCKASHMQVTSSWTFAWTVF